MSRLKLSAEQTCFVQGVLSCLELAVVNQWSGIKHKYKARFLTNEVFTWFTETKGLFVSQKNWVRKVNTNPIPANYVCLESAKE